MEPVLLSCRIASKAGRLHSGELQVPTLCQGNGEVLPGNLGTCLVLGVLKDVGVFFSMGFT